MKKTKKIDTYAKVEWTADDVKSIRMDWSMERCEEELHGIEKRLQERTIELGWDVMDDLLPTE